MPALRKMLQPKIYCVRSEEIRLPQRDSLPYNMLEANQAQVLAL
jgi:hypothetical protein